MWRPRGAQPGDSGVDRYFSGARARHAINVRMCVIHAGFMNFNQF